MLFGSGDNRLSAWQPRRLHLVRRCFGLLLVLLALLATAFALLVHRYLQLFHDRPVAIVDARVLRWQLPAALAGVPSLYRLDRIAGRYDDIIEERSAPRSVYTIGGSAGPDLFNLKRDYPRWLPFIDAQYGSATWMPMFDGARYIILFNDRGGLLARPADGHTAQNLRDLGTFRRNSGG